MGDVLSGVFGGGQSGSQNTTVDATTQRLNQIKLDQAMTLLGYPQNAGTATGQFAQPSDVYQPSSQVTDLFNNATDPNSRSPLLSYSDYANSGVQSNNDLLTAGINNIQGNTDTALQQGATRYADQYNTAYNTGLNQTGNYISQIATPQIKQALALQGLEGGGALPEAIAKATASIGLPYAQSLIPMMQQYLQGQQGIQQAGQQQQASLYGTDIPVMNSFQQSLPGASTGLAMTPLQQQQMQAQTASTLFPLADYGRSLQEQDLLRRQGLATTAITGIPYTPQTNVKQSTSSQPLFNWFGQG